MYRISSHEWRIVALGCSGHIHGNAEPDDASNGVGSADFGLVVILASSHFRATDSSIRIRVGGILAVGPVLDSTLFVFRLLL